MAPFEYLKKTSDLLDKAKAANVFSEKMQFINESITTYGQGSNLDKLQMLVSFDTNLKIDYTLPDIKAEILNEYYGHRNMFHGWKVAISEIAFLIVALAGIVLDWDTLDDGYAHIVWGATITLLVVILVLL